MQLREGSSVKTEGRSVRFMEVTAEVSGKIQELFVGVTAEVDPSVLSLRCKVLTVCTLWYLKEFGGSLEQRMVRLSK